MNKLPYFLIALSFFLSACSSGPFILDPYPPPESIVRDSIIVIKFRVAEAVDIRSFNETSLGVHGTRTGPLSAQVRYTPEKQEVQMIIQDSLYRDEEIYVVVTDSLRLANGEQIPQGVWWKFWVDILPSQLAGNENDADIFYVAVDELPEPIGGIAEIQRRVDYPNNAKRANVQGMVFIAAYVDETGTVTKTELLQGIGGGCDEAAAKAIRETRFKPGKRKGQLVKVKLAIPIRFRITR